MLDPRLYAIYLTQIFCIVEKFTIDHVAAKCGRLSMHAHAHPG